MPTDEQLRDAKEFMVRWGIQPIKVGAERLADLLERRERAAKILTLAAVANRCAANPASIIIYTWAMSQITRLRRGPAGATLKETV